uniref:Uncharacterized protein n=1 Tax=Micrurus spixii TaxID=129469 RepID=A0A2D4LQP4_9SAUR
MNCRVFSPETLGLSANRLLLNCRKIMQEKLNSSTLNVSLSWQLEDVWIPTPRSSQPAQHRIEFSELKSRHLQIAKVEKPCSPDVCVKERGKLRLKDHFGDRCHHRLPISRPRCPPNANIHTPILAIALGLPYRL